MFEVVVDSRKTNGGIPIAIIGEGAVGVSSALALIERDRSLNITVFHDVPFEQTVSFGPAGLFRVDTLQNRFETKIN